MEFLRSSHHLGRPRPAVANPRRLSALEPLRPSRLLDTLLPGHRSQNVTLWEAALFSLSSGLFVAASMAPFYGFRRVQNAVVVFAPRSSRHACQRERSTLKRRLPVGRNIIPGAGRRSTSERPLLSALSASSSRTACATSAGNISYIDLLSYKYHRPDRPSSCVLFATTKCAYVEQAGTYSHLYSISAACLPPSTN